METEARWEILLGNALTLIDDAVRRTGQPVDWSLGGGTVLMLRLNHRQSKDIDIFISDQQLLGLFSPRLSDFASALTDDYDESSGHIKLFLPRGEIDIVVATPLIETPYETVTLLSRSIKLERSAEIIAKKMWHRGDRATARDLLDFASVYESDPKSITEASPFLSRHAYEFLTQISLRQAIMSASFDAIDKLDSTLTFRQCVEIAEMVLRPYCTPRAL